MHSLLKRKVKQETVKLKDGAEVKLTKECNPDYNFLLGKEGFVKSDLKPSGKAKINGKIYDVSSGKDYIYASNKIKVVRVENTRIIVEKIK